MKTTNNNFWKNLAEVGRSILAHVSISYDGSTGSLHIDIVPTDNQCLSQGQQNLICSQPNSDCLPNATENNPKGQQDLICNQPHPNCLPNATENNPKRQQDLICNQPHHDCLPNNTESSSKGDPNICVDDIQCQTK